MEQERAYIAIDLKSFYASVECRERNRDPLTTNLVVADESRTEKTICLAVSPSLKSFGVPGRPRLFEVVQQVNDANNQRMQEVGIKTFLGYSDDINMLQNNPKLGIDYIVARPRMARYMEYSTKIYQIYLKYVSPEDMHIYSVDEVFMDVTNYLRTYKTTAKKLAMTIIEDVLKATGITATVGIGTNLYLAKIAMDIGAKHSEADSNGVRLAELNERTYREKLWGHKPITDFWRVGRGYANKLARYGIYTMGDVARCSLGEGKGVYSEDFLYKLFGVNAELLIDHAWGYEPCKIEDIKNYKPQNNSLCSGQVLQNPYSFSNGRIVVREMAESLVLDLVEKKLVTDQIVLTVGYDIENLIDPTIKNYYKGEVTRDSYGRSVPKHAHGTVRLNAKTSSLELITKKVMNLYDQIVDKRLLIRRVTISADRLIYKSSDAAVKSNSQEENLEETIIKIKKKFGKNTILRGMSLEENATAIDRNKQIGGHRA